MKVSIKDTKERIEKVLSEILSDKYELKITLKFIGRNTSDDENKTQDFKKE